MIVHKSSLASGRRERIGDSRNKRGAVEEVSASPESIPAVCLRSSSFIYFPAASSSRWLFISFLYRTRRRPGRNRIRAHPSFLSLAQFQRPPKSNSAAALLIIARQLEEGGRTKKMGRARLVLIKSMARRTRNKRNSFQDWRRPLINSRSHYPRWSRQAHGGCVLNVRYPELV